MEGRRLWEIGSWGGASDQIGERWEEIGSSILAQLVFVDSRLSQGGIPPRLLTLAGDTSLQAGIRSTGLTNPDAILVEPVGGSISLAPIDFKWSLETASYKQISAAALTDLMDHSASPLIAALDGMSVEQDSPKRGYRPRDGYFVSPDSEPNRAFLESSSNRRQEYPIQDSDVVLVPVDGDHFFSALPWWWLARRLADADRMTASLLTLEGADRYYRLGAGVGGAIVKSLTPVFSGEPAEVDVATMVESFLADPRQRSSQALVTHARRLMSLRADRVQHLKEIHRCPYGFRQMLDDVVAAGGEVGGDDESIRRAKERWGRIHRQVVVAHREAVNAAGLRAMAKGASEVAALGALDERRFDLERRARTMAHRLIREELCQPGR